MKTIAAILIGISLLSCSKDKLITQQGVWNKIGSVILPGSKDNFNVAEPTLLYDSCPKLLKNTKMVYKMWFRNGNNNINYAESLDGKDWIRDTGTVLNQKYCPYVFKHDSIYYLYCVEASWHSLDCYTSNDGIHFVLEKNNVIPNFNSYGNTAIAYEDNKWYMFYEASQRTVDGYWKIYEAVSNDGINWTTNYTPIIAWQGCYGGPVYQKINGLYYLWVHGSVTGCLPTDLYRFKSSNLTDWQRDVNASILPRTTYDEGVNYDLGQIADPFIMEVNNKSYMFYSGGRDGTGNLKGVQNFTIKLAIANMPLSQLVQTTEGVE
jgi:hypothetical protein